jgi:hypothetical protein
MEKNDEEINNQLLSRYYSIYIDEKNVELPDYITANEIHHNIKLVFVNGRYHGLMPSIGPEDYYDGHPGIFNQAIINALCTGANNVLIIMSAKEEGFGSEYPIEALKKQEFIQKWVDILKTKLPDNIIMKLKTTIPHFDVESFKAFLENKISNIEIKIAPMGAGNPNLVPIFNEKLETIHATRDQSLMITGLEKKADSDLWYNKYENVFRGIKFILLTREGGISGTEIRKAVSNDDYMQIAHWLIDAGMGDDEEVPALVGEIIHSINQSDQTDVKEEQCRVYEHIGLTEAEKKLQDLADKIKCESTKKRKITKMTDYYPIIEKTQEEDFGEPRRKIDKNYPGKASRGGLKSRKRKQSRKKKQSKKRKQYKKSKKRKN